MPRQSNALNAYPSPLAAYEALATLPSAIDAERWFELAVHTPGVRARASGGYSPSRSEVSERGPAFFLGGR